MTSTLYPTTPHAYRSAQHPRSRPTPPTRRRRRQGRHPSILPSKASPPAILSAAPTVDPPQPLSPASLRIDRVTTAWRIHLAIEHLHAVPSSLQVRIASLQPSVSLTLVRPRPPRLLCACTRFCLEALPELAARNLPVLHDSWSFGRSPARSQKPPTQAALTLAPRPPHRLRPLPHRNPRRHPPLRLPRPRPRPAHPRRRLRRHPPRRLRQPRHRRGRHPHRQHGSHHSKVSAPTPPPPPPAPRLLRRMGQAPHPLPALGRRARRSRQWPLPRHPRSPHHPRRRSPPPTPTSLCSPGAEPVNRVPLARVIAQRNWHHLRAVREGRVVCIPDQLLNTPAPTLLRAPVWPASHPALHPSLYPPHPDLVTLDRSAVPSSGISR